MSVVWINILLILVEQMRADDRLDSASVLGVKGSSSSRAGQDYTGVIGALFEWAGLKLELVHSGSRPPQATM